MSRLFLFNTIKAHLLWALIVFSIGANGQNLVPNYSFESYIICPYNFYKPPSPPWYIPTNYNPVYCNACDTDIYAGVPINTTKGISFQYARTGGAYIYLDYDNGLSRTYIQIRLSDSLKAGHFYYAEHFVNVPNPMKYACNNIGMFFTNKAVYVDTNTTAYGVLPANPQIINYGNPIITDTLNWVKVSGIFKALGGEKYLTLGNFKDFYHTSLLQIQPTGYAGAGYFIDDVSVYDLDSFKLKADAGRDTTITVGDSAFIGSFTNGIDTIQWLQNGVVLIDTIRPGFWVYPTTNTYYVLTQTVNGYTSSDTVYVTVKPLPLQFISYSVNEIKDHSVVNKWITANEINVHHYNIEKSIDSKIFNSIGIIKAQDKQANQYELVDKNVIDGIIYYRVVGVDNDGRKSYSEIKKISTINDNQISIYPNPTSGAVNIQLPISGNWQITATDIEGRVVWEHECSGCSGIIKHNFEGSKGLYFVKIINTVSGQETVKKVILQ